VLHRRVRLLSFPFFFFDLLFLLDFSSSKQVNESLEESNQSVQDPRQQGGPVHGTQSASKGRQSSVGLFEGEDDNSAVEGNLVGLANGDLVGLLEGRRVGRTTGDLVGRLDGGRVGRAKGEFVATGDDVVLPIGVSVRSCVGDIVGRMEGCLVVMDRKSWLGEVGRTVGVDVGDAVAMVGSAVGQEVGTFVGVDVSVRQRVSESSISMSASSQTRSAIHW